MVLVNALCALNLASTMMANGVCCFYEMQREEERKTEQQLTIRQAVHSEWERQRYMEMMERQRENEIQAAALQMQRRQRLMMTKQAFMEKNEVDTSSRTVNSEPRDYPAQCSRSAAQRPRSHSFAALRPDTFQPIDATSPRTCYDMKSHPASPYGSTSSIQNYPERQLSSLMDESLDDLEDVCME